MDPVLRPQYHSALCVESKTRVGGASRKRGSCSFISYCGLVRQVIYTDVKPAVCAVIPMSHMKREPR